MATQRYISTSFWDDPWISEIEPDAKLLYLYLMTNPLTNIAGVYELTEKRICFDTGMSVKKVKSLLDEFKKRKKAFMYNNTMVLPSWPKHQKWQSRSKIKDGIISVLQEKPQDLLNYLHKIGYTFDLSLVATTIISTKIRTQISGSTIKRVKEKYSNKCAECETGERLVIHHKLSIKEGGDNSFDNLELLCTSCHIKKHSPDMVYGLEIESASVPNYSEFDSDIDSNSNIDSEVEEKNTKHKHGEYNHVLLTESQYSKLLEDWGESELSRMITKLDEGIQMKGYKYKDHNLTLRKWKRDEKPNSNSPTQSFTDEEIDAIWK